MPSTKPDKLKKDVLSEESNKTEESGKQKKGEKDEEPITQKRKEKKRKVQEKENVTEDSIIQEDKLKKDVLSEESNKTDKSGKQKNGEKDDEPITLKRKEKKRKVQEKENVTEDSIIQEVQMIKDPDESEAKKRKGEADKQSKSRTPVTKDGREENQNLPEGWVRKDVVRKSGKTAGQVDIYIYSPDGKKFRSRPDLAAYLMKTKSNMKMEQFNFSKKKASDDLVTKDPPKKEKPTPTAETKKLPEKKKSKVSASPKKGSKIVKKIAQKELETDKDKKASGKNSKAK